MTGDHRPPKKRQEDTDSIVECKNTDTYSILQVSTGCRTEQRRRKTSMADIVHIHAKKTVTASPSKSERYRVQALSKQELSESINSLKYT